MTWQPDGPTMLVRWQQQRLARKYGPPQMSWIEAEMLAEQLESEITGREHFAIFLVALFAASGFAATLWVATSWWLGLSIWP